MSSPRLYYKENTPVSLNSILLSSPYLCDNWKLIPSVVRALNVIQRWNNAEGGFSSITRTFFSSRFGSNYTTIIAALENLDLMRVHRQWIKHVKCFDYYLTPKCQKALADTNKEYLYLLLTDKQTRRKNQKAISARGHKKYGDIRDEIKFLNDNVEIDFAVVDKVIKKMPVAKQAVVWSLLIDIEKKDYDLKFNEKDGRVWSPYTQLPSDIKRVITIKKLTPQQVADIRSCYPSLWAQYIMSLSASDGQMEKERTKWNNLFLDPSRNPKKVIAKAIGADPRDIKEVMIKYFNGKIRGKSFRAFDLWLSKQFPMLYARWKATDIKQTGNNIGKYFETKLMLDKSIYDRAEMLGIIIGYEYDGFTLYAKNNSKCDELLAYIEQRSIELLGIKLVFVDKKETLSIADILEDQKRQNIEMAHERWLKVCRRTFRKDASPDWEEFRMERILYHQELESYFKESASRNQAVAV